MNFQYNDNDDDTPLLLNFYCTYWLIISHKLNFMSVNIRLAY